MILWTGLAIFTGLLFVAVVVALIRAALSEPRETSWERRRDELSMMGDRPRGIHYLPTNVLPPDAPPVGGLPPTDDPCRDRLARDARHLTSPRAYVRHDCAGTGGCLFCAEMREAYRREELGIHFVGWGAHASRCCSPTGTGDTTRSDW